MAKRIQQESGEERVTAKSKSMMNRVARTPSFVSSSTSVSPGKRWYGNQDPWRSVVADDRSWQPDGLSPADNSKLDDDRDWSSQKWKTETMTYDRSGQSDKASWRVLQHVCPHHGDPLLDGTAQSVRNGEPLRDRSGQLDDVNCQEEANPQNSSWEVTQQDS